jgi:hypothetical protein
MKPFTARVVYCVCLSGLVAACAAIPDAKPVVTADAPLAPSLRARISPVDELAGTMRLHAELAYSYRDASPSIIQITSAQASLRDNSMLASEPEFEHELIWALSNELADARRDRAVAAVRYGAQHPELVKADAVVAALTAAVNAEVRRAKSLV